MDGTLFLFRHFAYPMILSKNIFRKCPKKEVFFFPVKNTIVGLFFENKGLKFIWAGFFKSFQLYKVTEEAYVHNNFNIFK